MEALTTSTTALPTLSMSPLNIPGITGGAFSGRRQRRALAVSGSNPTAASLKIDYKDFDWRSYLELNPDLTNAYTQQMRSEAEALQHFATRGFQENRPYQKLAPYKYSWKQAMNKLNAFSARCNKTTVSLDQRNLVIYHVADLADSAQSIEVQTNNIKIFAHAVREHTHQSTHVAFYLFNVVGLHGNLLQKHIPKDLPNVEIVYWERASSDLNTHLLTLELLGPSISSDFSAIFFLSSGVRGPLVFSNKGAWLVEFRNLLDINEVGIVGPTTGSEKTVHISTHVFCIRSTVVGALLTALDKYRTIRLWRSVLDYFDIELSNVVRDTGLNMASVLHYNRLHMQRVVPTALTTSEYFYKPWSKSREVVAYKPQSRQGFVSTNIPSGWNLQSWCHLRHADVIFMRWGGDGLGTDRYFCGVGVTTSLKSIVEMNIYLQQLNAAKPSLRLDLTETARGGQLFQTYVEYRRYLQPITLAIAATVEPTTTKTRSKKKKSRLSFRSAATHSSPKLTSKVCFIVRSVSSQENLQTSKDSRFSYFETNIRHLVSCKLL